MKNPLLILAFSCLSLFAIGQIHIEKNVGQEYLSKQPTQIYLKDAIDFLKGKKTTKSNFTIVRRYSDTTAFYQVKEFADGFVRALKMAPPNLLVVNDELIAISNDSISDVIWIVGKKWTGVLNTIRKIPFKKLKGKFKNLDLSKMQLGFDKTKAINRIIDLYGSLIIKKTEGVILMITKQDGSIDLLSERVDYPEQANMNGIQGMAIVGFVVSPTCKITNICKIQDPGYGCADAVIDALERLQKKLESMDCGIKAPEFYEAEVNFILQ
jgi:TonB-like protein